MPWEGTATSFAPAAVAAPLIVACLLAGLGRVLPRLAVDVLAIAATAGVIALDVALLLATRHGRVVTWVGGWTPSHEHSVGISLVADRLGAGLALLAAVLVLAALTYSWRYLEDVGAHYQVLVLVFLAGTTGFALSGDSFDMFVFFELMGAVAYALTGFLVEDRTAVQGRSTSASSTPSAPTSRSWASACCTRGTARSACRSCPGRWPAPGPTSSWSPRSC